MIQVFLKIYFWLILCLINVICMRKEEMDASFD